MKGWQVGLVAILMSSLLIVKVHALPSTNLLIAELQTGSSLTTSEDFVELFNTTDQAIDLTTWRLEYRATTTTSQWTKKAQLLGSISAHGRYLIATQGYLEDTANATFTSGLSKTGGSLRLVKVGQKGGEDEVIDLVGWGKAIAYEGDKAASSPVDGQSLVRREQSDGSLLDTDQNQADFRLTDTPTPASSGTSDSPETDPDVDPNDAGSNVPVDSGDDEPTTTVPLAPEVNADVWITELFADPASPQTDANDEFIELYNAGSMAVDLRGYVLQAGLTYSHGYVLSDVSLAPGQYLALPSSTTKMALSNSGSRARLVNSDGGVIYETPAYDSAKTGQAFALSSDGSWQWTEQPTPNVANDIVVTSAPPKPVATTAPKTTTTKKTATPKVTATKSSTKVASTKAKTASSKVSNTNPPANAVTGQSQSPKISGKWLVVLGSGTLLYGAYEYREDIANKLHQLRRHRRAGDKAGH